MASDPREVMAQVIDLEASRLQSMADDDLLGEALGIAEAERRRSRLADRLEVAVGTPVTIGIPGETVCGIVSQVGTDLVMVRSEMIHAAVSLGHVLYIAGIPNALRPEMRQTQRIPLTWAAGLRRLQDPVAARIILSDGTRIRGHVIVVGDDHADVRDAEGNEITVPFTAMRAVISSR